MIYRKYGSTNIEVSAIGFGGMRFNDENDIDMCASLVKAAYDNGINYFDTAPAYERSEEIFGVALKEMKKTSDKKPFYIATKTLKQEPGEVRKDFETSLKRMDLDYIDFHHVWCVMTLDDFNNRKTKGVLAEFEKLKDQGLVKHICVSTHMTGPDVEKMLTDYSFDGVLLGYSAMNFAYRDAGLDAAAKLNRAITVMNPLGGGVIPKNPNLFEFLKTDPDQSAVEAALGFLLNDPRITIALVGLSDHDQLAEALSAVEKFKPISDETIQKMRSGLRDSFNELCTACRYCEDKCPENIPIPKMMDAFNRYMLDKDLKLMIDLLQFGWNLPPKSPIYQACSACGRCELACTQKLPIIDRIAQIREKMENHLKTQDSGTKGDSRIGQ